MQTTRRHKIALEPTADQEQAFRRAAGVARWTWNWALAEWNRQDQAGEKPTAFGLKKPFGAIKGEQFRWLYDSPRDANSQPVATLGKAFARFFNKEARRPRFKKKGKSRDAFYVAKTSSASLARRSRCRVLATSACGRPCVLKARS